ncbi:alanine/glycine:cation symporter family protein [Anaerosacchariphilus polymeriproducens]|uniref:Sodium:alanine symporter family protein n=1 Tax=Anaerosacchariphilus polymeriproducens TaxID=1812858 RepID=A0A371ARG4_9FIRM|nr:sodium:alanine symporter family protein [Anaerosacchariphilus polymeriproducens]RDU22157.1 sodium:alanine symporter family protein [Anaerosacchariphilus polymeriproducens]
MSNIVNWITKFNGILNGFIWGPVMLVFFLFVGIMFTIRTGIFQITNAKIWINNTILACFKKKDVRKSEDKHAISQFQSVCTALAATLGTGNIAGVATAITAGGPGAVFWMWVSAFFGTMTNYAENTLGIFYRYKNEKNDWIGGAMVYMERGLHCKWLAVIFSLFCVLASFGIGNMTQANSIAEGLKEVFHVPPVMTGIVLMIGVALVVIGGIKRIAGVTEKLVPFMAGIYMIGAFAVIVIRFQYVPAAFASIFREAFNFKAAGGGALGYGIMLAVRKGISRGVFSNEAGLGSSVMVHSASNVKDPVIQGMWGIFQVCVDTLIVCTMTALVILTAGLYDKDKYAEYYTSIKNNISQISSEVLSESEEIVSTQTGEMALNNVLLITQGGLNNLKETCNISEIEGRYVLYNAEDCINKIISQGQNALKKRKDLARYAKSDKFFELRNDTLNSVDKNIKLLDSTALTGRSFDRIIPYGAQFVSISVLLFAFATLVGWSYYGERAVEYLFGLKAVFTYKIVFVIIVFVGCTMSLELVWNIADTLNGFMAVPNLIAITLLSGKVITLTKEYIARNK